MQHRYALVARDRRDLVDRAADVGEVRRRQLAEPVDVPARRETLNAGERCRQAMRQVVGDPLGGRGCWSRSSLTQPLPAEVLKLGLEHWVTRDHQRRARLLRCTNRIDWPLYAAQVIRTRSPRRSPV